MANNSIKAAFERLWQHVVAGLGGKSDVGHTHDDIYCTEAKVDSKLSAINTSISNITSGTTAVKKAESATTAGSATKATQDGNGKVISSTYETKTDATAKLNTAKAYTDSEMTRLVGDTAVSAQVSTALNTAKSYTDTEISELINSAPTTLDTLGEIATAMSENADVVEALESAVGTKANASDLTAHTGNKSNPHGVTLAQLGVTATAAELNLLDGVTATTAELNYVDGVTSNIQTQLNGKAAASDLNALKTLVGDTAVATQISNAIASKSDTGHGHDDYMTKANPTGSGTLTMDGDGDFSGAVSVESLQIGGVTLNHDATNGFLEFVFTSTTDTGAEV